MYDPGAILNIYIIQNVLLYILSNPLYYTYCQTRECRTGVRSIFNTITSRTAALLTTNVCRWTDLGEICLSIDGFFRPRKVSIFLIVNHVSKMFAPRRDTCTFYGIFGGGDGKTMWAAAILTPRFIPAESETSVFELQF